MYKVELRKVVSGGKFVAVDTGKKYKVIGQTLPSGVGSTVGNMVEVEEVRTGRRWAWPYMAQVFLSE